MPLIRGLLLAGLAAAAVPAHAHVLLDGHIGDRLPALLTALLLLGAWAAYVAGDRRLPASHADRLLFHGTFALAALTLLGPFDSWAETSSAMHMVQHMMLMVVVAPSAVLARPLPQWRVALGGRLRALWAWPLRATRLTMTMAAVHGAMIWFWHTPRPYMLAVEHPWWHAVEHACFLFSAGLFWWAVLRASPPNRGRAMLALLFTLMHTGLLGALLTFANAPIYREASSLQDQQLAGLIMWVPGGIAYLASGAWCANRWARRLARRAAPAARAPH